LCENLNFLIKKHGFERFEYQLPDEYRVDEQLKSFCDTASISCKSIDTEHFMSTRDELGNFFEGKKTYLMESFYRNIRRRYNIMMDGDKPLTGKWNYDAENRKKLPKNHVPVTPLIFEKDVTKIHDRITKNGVKTIGNIDPKRFIWATAREEGLALLKFFNENCLPSIAHWEANSEEISIAQIEGFVRQIIGWREYMRGVYWAKMPEYATLNYLEHDRKLPHYFWTGETKMNCVKHAVTQSLDYAYAHHIQRLMVTGNFALLAGIHPDEVDAWYLGIYIDALDWVEITNTRGMSQFADGGIVGTKPYVSSANYMHKMSHYCGSCFYDRKEKTGERACPFNSLYWHFYDRHTDKLSKNPRIGMAYRLWNKMDGEKRTAILEQAEKHLENIENL